ncbi:MAG: alanine dehydrogenase [Spirochaetaceae bacterium]|jgi:alanine dehydrogenase|nr:alanine dehydrogenase [Spirochaetaceae bacterium]
MIIGLVKEIKTQESRVGLTPNGVAAYKAAGHRVLVEARAGEGSGFTDDEYRNAGGEILDSAKAVWGTSQMIVKVKEPIASEYAFLREDMILYTYLHLAADKPLTDALLGSKTKGVAYETITDEYNGLPCLTPMSQIAGRMAVAQGAKYLETTYGGRGMLLAGVPGVEKGKVVILGGGTVGTEACKIAAGLGADVVIMDVNLRRLAVLDDLFGSRIHTLYSTPENVRASIATADVVVGAVLIPGKKAPRMVTKADLSLMKKGSVLVDVAVDQGGCFETTKATTHEKPVFIEDGIVHYCVANMPGAVARTSTLALTNATLTPGLKIADKGLEWVIANDRNLTNGVNTYKGRCTFAGVAEAFGIPYVPVTELI